METIFAQIVADLWKVPPEDVVIALADTGAISVGFGTMASRSTVTASGAMCGASERLKEKVFAVAAGILECAPADLELRDGGVGIAGVPGETIPFARIAGAVRPTWISERPAEADHVLEETCYWQPQTVTWSYAVHAAIVEVDPDTGHVSVIDYAVTHDCGTVVNPMLVEGQIMGGAAQGLGGILSEAIAYDADGQLLSGSLMDYALPKADEVPSMHIMHQHAPSPGNPLGVKGVGEGGAVAPPAAIANAVCDALAPYGVEINRTPIKPEALAATIAAARKQRQ
jgi:aerobic carbon-monoxide dehydrogenase large subunit